jgi:lysophospholipase L1-like esterase
MGWDHHCGAIMSIAALPLISQYCPAYASDEAGGAAALATNGNYADYWYASSANPTTLAPIWLAYDLSSVPSGQRGQCVVVWYADANTNYFDYTIFSGGVAWLLPVNYTIQGNAASGGGSAPSSGWVTLATVTSNVLHSRQHNVNLTGYNWVRMSITSAGGSGTGISLEMDVHNAATGVQDDWLLLGDSIVQNGMMHDNVAPGGTLPQIIHGMRSSYFPIMENGGTAQKLSADGASNIARWLATFAGKYVGLSYGTNDAINSVSPATFQTNMLTMINAVLAASCIPIIPLIPWGRLTALQTNVPALNAVIQGLYASYPAIIPGPDLYAFFNANQALINTSDDIHPTASGYGFYRWLWAGTLVRQVYSSSSAFSSLMAHT